MPTRQLDISGLSLLLQDIVERWPKTGKEDLAEIRKALQRDLADDFDAVDLLNRIESVAEIENVELIDGGAAVYFYDVDGCLQRALFDLPQSDRWKLKSLKFQCPVCFGSGVNDDKECSICGGSGWGAS
jgi:hypothetical protein